MKNHFVQAWQEEVENWTSCVWGFNLENGFNETSLIHFREISLSCVAAFTITSVWRKLNDIPMMKIA